MVLALLASLCLGSSASRAAAAPRVARILPCLLGVSNYFDGYYSYAAGPLPGGTFEGSSAFVRHRRGEVCDTGSTNPQVNFNTSWVMVAANLSQGPYRGYAQVGYFRGYGDIPHYFVEFKKNAADSFHRYFYDTWGLPSYGELHQLTVGYGAGAIWMTVDSTSLAHTPWDPYAADAFNTFGTGPMETQLNSEATYTGSDVPGDYTYRTTWDSILVQTWNGHQWTGSLPTYYTSGPTSARWTQTSFNYGLRSFHTWTI